LTDNAFNILAVDDEPLLLDIYKDILESTHLREICHAGPASVEGRVAPRFSVTCCTNAQGALDAVERSFETDTAFSAIFLDVNMPPGPSGIWAAEKILKIDPAANIVLVTGYIGSDSDNLPRHLNFCDRLLFLPGCCSCKNRFTRRKSCSALRL